MSSETCGLDNDPGDLVGVTVTAGSPVLQVAVSLGRNLPGYSDMKDISQQSSNISTSPSLTCLMLQPLLATPALKSWMLEVSLAPASLRSLSFPS